MAKASRDFIITAWRMQKRKVNERKQSRKARSMHTRAKYSNLIALVVKRQPELLPQARGRLLGAKKATKREMARLRPGVSLHGAGEALRAYIEEHRASSAAELEELKQTARCDPSEHISTSSCPQTQSEFCKWIDQNGTRWKEAVQSAGNGGRRQANTRCANPGRQAPARPKSELKWRALLSHGFFALVLPGGGRITLFAVSCGGRQAGMLLMEVPGRGFRLGANAVLHRC